MTSKYIIKDKVLSDLMSKTKLEKPSTDFTDKIMSKVKSEKVLNPEFNKPLLNTTMWFIIGFAMIIGISSIFFLDFSFVTNLFSQINTEKFEVITFMTNIKSYFNNIFQGIQVSSISIMLIISVVSLFFLDRIINKLKLIHIFLF